jgi:hypothetical protein
MASQKTAAVAAQPGSSTSWRCGLKAFGIDAAGVAPLILAACAGRRGEPFTRLDFPIGRE